MKVNREKPILLMTEKISEINSGKLSNKTGLRNFLVRNTFSDEKARYLTNRSLGLAFTLGKHKSQPFRLVF